MVKFTGSGGRWYDIRILMLWGVYSLKVGFSFLCQFEFLFDDFCLLDGVAEDSGLIHARAQCGLQA